MGMLNRPAQRKRSLAIHLSLSGSRLVDEWTPGISGSGRRTLDVNWRDIARAFDDTAQQDWDIGLLASCEYWGVLQLLVCQRCIEDP
jgi:hypothetical protein